MGGGGQSLQGQISMERESDIDRARKEGWERERELRGKKGDQKAFIRDCINMSMCVRAHQYVSMHG